MSLSRSENRKRAPLMTPGRWILLIAGFLLFAAVWFVLYVRTADADYQSEENRAIKLAKQEAGLKSASEAYKHVWEETVWVVVGKDAEGVKWFVWEKQDGIVKEREDDGESKDEIADRFGVEHPGKKIVRLMPGWFQGQPAWEIRYVADPSNGRQAIDFYSFKEGSKLKTYDLPGK